MRVSWTPSTYRAIPSSPSKLKRLTRNDMIITVRELYLGVHLSENCCAERKDSGSRTHPEYLKKTKY